MLCDPGAQRPQVPGQVRVAPLDVADEMCIRDSVRSALRVFSIVVTWSLESGLITADSMRCRGYGLPGRTSFSLYRLSLIHI